ncbi:MAG: hypothetical protein ACYCR2_05845 [Thermoplasmataceae archaeon]
MVGEREIPEGLGDLLDELSMILSGLASNMPTGKTVSGKDLVDAFSGLRTGQRINVIPGGTPGSCHWDLVVAIGARDSVEKRILQAIEHVLARCMGITVNVVIAALSWNSEIWNKHKNSFARKSVNVILLMPETGAIRLV